MAKFPVKYYVSIQKSIPPIRKVTVTMEMGISLTHILHFNVMLILIASEIKVSSFIMYHDCYTKTF